MDYSLAITIGFNRTTYNVRESDGSVSLTIGVMEGELHKDVTIPIKLTTVDGSADGKQTYACCIVVQYYVYLPFQHPWIMKTQRWCLAFLVQ